MGHRAWSCLLNEANLGGAYPPVSRHVNQFFEYAEQKSEGADAWRYLVIFLQIQELICKEPQ